MRKHDQTCLLVSELLFLLLVLLMMIAQRSSPAPLNSPDVVGDGKFEQGGKDKGGAHEDPHVNCLQVRHRWQLVLDAHSCEFTV
mgnify:CR=1 FL=1